MDKYHLPPTFCWIWSKVTQYCVRAVTAYFTGNQQPDWKSQLTVHCLSFNMKQWTATLANKKPAACHSRVAYNSRIERNQIKVSLFFSWLISEYNTDVRLKGSQREDFQWDNYLIRTWKTEASLLLYAHQWSTELFPMFNTNFWFDLSLLDQLQQPFWWALVYVGVKWVCWNICSGIVRFSTVLKPPQSLFIQLELQSLVQINIWI